MTAPEPRAAVDAAWLERFVAEPIMRATIAREPHGELVLIRHGEAVPEDVSSLEAVLDAPLTVRGRRQAHAVAAALADRPLAAVYSSPLRRARATAQALGRREGDVEVCDDLQEVRATAHALDVADDWERAGHRFVATGRWDSFPSYERGAELRRRVRATLDALARRHPQRRVAIVAHGGAINAYLADLLGLERDYFVRVANCSVTRVRVAGDRRAVWSINETSHLPGELLTV